MTRHKKMITAIAIVLGAATLAGAGIGLIAGEENYAVSKDEAKEIALAHAGFSEGEVTLGKVKTDKDDGRTEYEVEFRKDGVKYEYEIDAESGAIISFDRDEKKTALTDSNGSPAVETSITADEAKAIALAHADLTETDVTFTKVKLDRDDGRDEYEIEFYAENVKYEYDIGAATGEILSYDKETKKKGVDQPQPVTEGTTASTSAPLPSVSPVTEVGSEVKSDEPKATASPVTNAVTAETAAPLTPEVTNEISADEAKAIALAHAGVAESEVRMKKVKLEYDDGRKEYEIEFLQGRMEYEYEIDALDGTILDFEIEYDD